MKKYKKNNSGIGFTLVELLVVISIIGLLVAVLVANFMGARERARDSQKIQDLNSMKNALRMYYNDQQVYPTGTGDSRFDSTFTTYMPGVVNIGYSYYYAVGNSGDTFTIKADLEAGEGTDSQLRCGIGVGSTQAGKHMVCAN